MKEYRLAFSGEQTGLLFLLAERDGGRFDCDSPFRMEDAFGGPSRADALSCGVHRVLLSAAAPRDVRLRCGDGVIPFLMPGPGITPSHFPKPVLPLRLAANAHYRLSAPIPRDQKSVYLACQQSGGAAPTLRILAGGIEVDPHWYPECAMPYRCARIAVEPGWLELDAQTRADMRLTLWEGNPLLLERPDAPLPMGRLRLCAVDGDGRQMDARFEVYANDDLVLQRDVLTGEDCAVELPEGAYAVLVHHGGRFSRAARRILLRAGETCEIRAALRELLPLPKGWAWGDEHIHSVFEDGSPLPDMILRAARATGSNYAFLTDHQVTELLRYGVSCADEPGVFVGMAGQEITCHELHMNILNAPWEIPDGLIPPGEVRADICDLIQGWLDEIGRMQEVQPVGFMLNHPCHDDATRSNPTLGYFRSWWVHDRFPQFALVENYDFQSWFDRLNRGERLTGVWTTDSHDCSRLYAGKKGTCVYVGDELSPASILSALEKGRSFSARWPGATLFLTVNGATMGDELRLKRGERALARVEAAAVLPIREIEIVANGHVTSTLSAHGAMQLTAEVELPEDALWAVARLRLEGGEWPKDDHCFEPLMVSGFAAFTNPVYIRREE